MKKVLPNTVVETKKSKTKKVSEPTIKNHIENAITSVVNDNSEGKTVQIIASSVALCLGLTFYLLGYESLLTLLVLVAGACWNYFMDSNKLFACLFSFLVCIPYALYSIYCGMYGQAFLHVGLYIPVQLMFYYNEKDNPDQSIVYGKHLKRDSALFLALFSVIFAVGLSAILYVIPGEKLFWFDACTVTLLAVSVFLVNGRFREYYFERVIAVGASLGLWIALGIESGWCEGSLMFSTLFALYFVVDSYRAIRFYIVNMDRDAKINKRLIKLREFSEKHDRNKKLPN